MTGVKLWTSGFESDCFTNWATTTSQTLKKLPNIFNLLPKWRNFAKSGHTFISVSLGCVNQELNTESTSFLNMRIIYKNVFSSIKFKAHSHLPQRSEDSAVDCINTEMINFPISLRKWNCPLQNPRKCEQT